MQSDSHSSRACSKMEERSRPAGCRSLARHQPGASCCWRTGKEPWMPGGFGDPEGGSGEPGQGLSLWDQSHPRASLYLNPGPLPEVPGFKHQHVNLGDTVQPAAETSMEPR
ncbi:uncharacterized protein LOC133233788 isoform X2 [Bos javanicus]|nr:uncharacterized protein LOC133233788 isoform X2 [Bos javanicus]